MPAGHSIKLVFSRHTVYELPLSSQPKFDKSQHMIATIRDPMGDKRAADDADSHPIYGPKRARVYHASLQVNEHYPPLSHKPAEQDVAVKWVRGEQAVRRLEHEAKLYNEKLAPLQGTVVPRFYGFFSAVIQGINVGCIVLEWYKETANRADAISAVNINRMVMLLLIHQAGIQHNDIIDAHHMLVLPNASIRIIDFSKASDKHKCMARVDAEGEIINRCYELEKMKELINRCYELPVEKMKEITNGRC
ncbi:hypothetical protein BKA93DRAFT_825403 [Sparassis latifolia]